MSRFVTFNGTMRITHILIKGVSLPTPQQWQCMTALCNSSKIYDYVSYAEYETNTMNVGYKFCATCETIMYSTHPQPDLLRLVRTAL